MNKKYAFSALIFFIALISLSYYSCVKDTGKLPVPVSHTLCDSLNVKYSTDIAPIIQTACVNTGCHAAGGGSSGIDISTYPLLKSFADQGRIRARVIDGATNGWMPNTGPLSVADRQKIDCWLNAGAPNN